MYDIRDGKLVECEESSYITLKRFTYTQCGRAKSWDLAVVHDSVAILLFNVELDSFVLVKQFRPPVYLQGTDGFTYELCAGITDKNLTLEEVAQEEILEECGYKVELGSIKRVTSFFTSVGFAGSRQTLFFAEVNESMRAAQGGGIDDEMIELVLLPKEQVLSFVMDESKPKTPGLMFALLWFLNNKKQSS